MTNHDYDRMVRAIHCDRTNEESLLEAVRGLQSTDDSSLMPLHDELWACLENLQKEKRMVEGEKNVITGEVVLPNVGGVCNPGSDELVRQLPQGSVVTLNPAATLIGGPEGDHPREVSILYKNWKGETDWRWILPLNIYFGKTEWHPEYQWLMEAFDLDKRAPRTFAVKDIQSWKVPT